MPPGAGGAQRAAARARPPVSARLVPADAAPGAHRRVLAPARRAARTVGHVELPRPRRDRVERPRRRLADLRERRAAQGRGHVRRRRARELARVVRGPRAALRDGRGDAGRRAIPGRPRAVRLDAEDERRARRGAAYRARGVPPEHRRELRARRRPARHAAAGRAERARRAAVLVPALRRVHRRLPVRREEHARLHLPQRRAGGGRDDPLLLRGDADRPAGRRWLVPDLPPAPPGQGGPPRRPARPDRRGRADCRGAGRRARRRDARQHAGPAPPPPQPAPPSPAPGARAPSLPRLSPRLGTGFSGNGDLLFFVRGADRWLDPSTGPTITATAKASDLMSPSGREFFLQDAGAPAASEWLWQAVEAPADLWRLRRTLWRRLGRRLRGDPDTGIGDLMSEAFGTARESAAMLPLLAMGRDIPGGRMTLHGDDLQVSWNDRESRAFFDGMYAAGRQLCRALGGGGGGGPRR